MKSMFRLLVVALMTLSLSGLGFAQTGPDKSSTPSADTKGAKSKDSKDSKDSKGKSTKDQKSKTDQKGKTDQKSSDTTTK